jgi:hypothetical protein
MLNVEQLLCDYLQFQWTILINYFMSKCKVTLLGRVTLLLLRKHIMFIFISWCKVLPNVAEWWSYGLCIIFHNLVHKYFIHHSPVLDLCWVNPISYPISCIPWRLHTPKGDVIEYANFWAWVNQHPAWYIYFFEWGLLKATLSPQKVRSELRGPDLV